MAKESTIRKKCKEELLGRDYVVWIPTRNRFGSGVTHTKDYYKAGDDIFNIFDLIGWKKDKILFVQYTGVKPKKYKNKKGKIKKYDNFINVYERERKIMNFINKYKLKLPKGVKVEVWGYVDREGFVIKKEIETNT